MNITKRLNMMFLTLLLVLGVMSAHAEDSNRNEVRANLEQNGYTVIWGKNFTEGDWAQLGASIVASVMSGSTAPFQTYLYVTVQEAYAKIASSASGKLNLTIDQLTNLLVESIRGQRLVEIDGLHLEAGFATYKRWQRIVYDEPVIRMEMECRRIFGQRICTKIPKQYMERKERFVDLPNWHQFYIRYRINTA